MAHTYTIRTDPKGRLLIPRALRDQLGINPGDTVFAQADEDGVGIRLAKAVNPFDALADHAVAEHAAGRTRSLRAFTDEQGIDLADE